MDTASIAALAGAAALASSGVFSWFQSRRTSGGRIGTSEAAVLWQQSQAMMTLLTEQRDRAEAQRDRLIQSQATEILPNLEKINVGLVKLVDAVAANGIVLARLEPGGQGGGGTGDG